MKILSKIIAFFMSILMTLFPSLFPQNDLEKDYLIKGSSLTVNLDANPSTGYSWSYEISDEDVIRFVHSTYTSGESNLAGSGGRESFVFSACHEGKATISFTYAQEWTEDPPARTAKFEITVDADGNISVEQYQIIITQ